MKTNKSNLFKQGLAIESRTNPMGFDYGEDCFGPQVENRLLDDIRPSLMEPDCEGPEVVYSIAMDVGKTVHREILIQSHLLFGLVTYSDGKLGAEPIRSQGHIHKRSAYGQGWSTPEVYQIWSGKGIIYMQEYASDFPGRCFAIHAGPGDIVIVPPFWAHATISADTDIPLTFGAWCDRDYGFEYADVRARKGLAWYPLINQNGDISWHYNTNYNKVDLIEKSPGEYKLLGIENKKCIYTQFEQDHDKFLFVPKPYLEEDLWKGFVP